MKEPVTTSDNFFIVTEPLETTSDNKWQLFIVTEPLEITSDNNWQLLLSLSL